MSQYIGGKLQGQGLVITCVPSSALKTTIDGYIQNGTEWLGKTLVKFTFSNNWEVALAGNGEEFDGIILDYSALKGAPYYRLAVLVLSVKDQNGNRWTPKNVVSLPYTAPIALHDTVVVKGTTARNVSDGTSGGFGAVIAKDEPSGYVSILF